MLVGFLLGVLGVFCGVVWVWLLSECSFALNWFGVVVVLVLFVVVVCGFICGLCWSVGGVWWLVCICCFCFSWFGCGSGCFAAFAVVICFVWWCWLFVVGWVLLLFVCFFVLWLYLVGVVVVVGTCLVLG